MEALDKSKETPRFRFGTTFRNPLVKSHVQVCTVTNYLRTYDMNQNLVKVRYIATHEVCGQIVADNDVLETTIARNLIKET